MVKFAKMQGTGNDFIVLEDFQEEYDGQQIAKKLCDRHFGVGGDGILLVKNSEIADIKMEIINADGSYAAMCGNGIRCFAKYVWEKGLVKKNTLSIETGDGIKEAILTIENNRVCHVKIFMGNPSFMPLEVPVKLEKEVIDIPIQIRDKEYHINSLRMGVPHTVIFGALDDFNVEEGKWIEADEIFPIGTNVNFCEVIDENHIGVKTWERGAGATLACGTGSCAAAVVSHKLGFTNKKMEVKVPGGKLEIEITGKGVFMAGPAENVFVGECEV